jgi:protein O-mannosyl-transferase
MRRKTKTKMTENGSYWKFFQIRPPYQVMLVIALILAAYYPVNFGEFCSVDDVGMVSSLEGLESWAMMDIFVPRADKGLYYRPLLSLSFFIDKNAFNLDPGIMHIENIVFHAINSLLLFWLVHQVLPAERKKKSRLPLVSALVFGLHPVTTESVSWVSGRTDVLACIFILLFKQHRFYRNLAISALFMLLGFLTKEAALAFLPGVLLIMTAKDGDTGENAPVRVGSPPSPFPLKYNTAIALCALGAVVFFFLLRSLAFSSNDGRINYTLQAIFLDGTHSTMVVLEVFAFYLKKLFFPFPLNFAIIEVDPLYELLGLPLLIGCLFLLSQRTVRSAFFMTGVFLIAPVFLAAFNQLAWTPVAERYLYMPSAFVTAAAVMYADDLTLKMKPLHDLKNVSLIAVLLIGVLAVSTFERSTVWKSNLALFKDTVEKSPTFYIVRAEYARALALAGDFKNARIQFEQANDENSRRGPTIVKMPFYSGKFGYWANADLGIAYILMREGRTAEAAEAYEKIFDRLREGEQSFRVLGQIVSLYSDLLGSARKPSDVAKIKKKLSFYTQKMYIKKRNPDAFFRLGRVSLLRGERQDALGYFRKSYDIFATDDAYKKIAEKHINRLKI